MSLGSSAPRSDGRMMNRVDWRSELGPATAVLRQIARASMNELVEENKRSRQDGGGGGARARRCARNCSGWEWRRSIWRSKRYRTGSCGREDGRLVARGESGETAGEGIPGGFRQRESGVSAGADCREARG